MGSRWFKILMGLMVIFVIQMVLRAQFGARAGEDSTINVSADQMIQDFQQDREMAMVKYAGKKVLVDGIVCSVIEGNPSPGVTIAGRMECESPLLIECMYWGQRKSRYGSLKPSYGVAFRGHVKKEQDNPGLIKLEYCRLMAEY